MTKMHRPIQKSHKTKIGVKTFVWDFSEADGQQARLTKFLHNPFSSYLDVFCACIKPISILWCISLCKILAYCKYFSVLLDAQCSYLTCLEQHCFSMILLRRVTSKSLQTYKKLLKIQHCQTRVNKTKKYVNIVLYSAPNLKIPLEIAKIGFRVSEVLYMYYT